MALMHWGQQTWRFQRPTPQMGEEPSEEATDLLSEYRHSPWVTEELSAALESELDALRDWTYYVRLDMRAATAQGARGNIWRGSLRNQVQVAVKTLIVQTDVKAQLESFVKEIKGWRHVQHPNILPLLGFYVTERNGFGMVTPWITGGTAAQLIRNSPNLFPGNIMLDTANAICYLHALTPPIVHGDLTTNNVLIGEHGQAVLADFGFSRFESEDEDISQDSSAVRGNWCWLAPERFFWDTYGFTRRTSLTVAADVWSLGHILYHLYSGKVPFEDVSNQYDLPDMVALSGIRPPRATRSATPVPLRDPLWDIIQKCWLGIETRPRAETVYSELTDVLSIS